MNNQKRWSTRFYIDPYHFGDFFRMFVFTSEIINGKAQSYAIVKPTLVEIEEGADFDEPLFRLNEAQCQELMDQLYRAGFVPTQSKSSKGQLQATEYHLEDMRKLVFEK